jgi:HD-GYP domain-containing protein (c-di-GMP phosphodiesterase class II)
MDSARGGATPHHFSPTEAEAFALNALPSILVPIHFQIHARHLEIAGLALLTVESDTRGFMHFADSAGRIEQVPEECRSWSRNPGLAALFSRGATGDLRASTDPVLPCLASESGRCAIATPVFGHHGPAGILIALANAAVGLGTASVTELRTWMPLLGRLVGHEMETLRTVLGTVRFARDFSLLRDLETGSHQVRMAAYTRIIAEQLSVAHGLPDGFADEVALFAPLHDIGKVGIPDQILLKPGKFEPLEWEQMKEHVSKGSEMVERLIRQFDLQSAPGMTTLRAIVAQHHECLDGSGYPAGLQGDAISLVARIVTTADILDALTCIRPYKRAWSMDEAMNHLRSLAGAKLDRDCIQAAASCQREIHAAWAGFAAQPATRH